MGEGQTREARRLAAHSDWSATPLGPRSQWPPQLEAAWEIALECPLPVALLCGADFTMLYNDAFRDLLGSKHPRPSASPPARSWRRCGTTPRSGPLLERTFTDAESFLDEGSSCGSTAGAGSPAGHGLAAPGGTADDGDVGYYLRSGSPVLGAGRRGAGGAARHRRDHQRHRSGPRRRQARGPARGGGHGRRRLQGRAAPGDGGLRRTVGLDLPAVAVALRRGGWPGGTASSSSRPDEERLPLIWSELGEEMASLIAQAIARRRALPVRQRRDRGGARSAPGGTRPRWSSSARPRRCRTTSWPCWRRSVSWWATPSGAPSSTTPSAPRPSCCSARCCHRTCPSPTRSASRPATSRSPRGRWPAATSTTRSSCRDGRLAMVIGDVVGRGVMAATVMGQVRAAVRGAALTNSEPGVRHGRPSTGSCGTSTRSGRRPCRWALREPAPAWPSAASCSSRCSTARSTPSTGEVVLASAGHPLPALLFGRASRARTAARGGCSSTMPVGPPLGIEGVRPAHHLTLGRGRHARRVHRRAARAAGRGLRRGRGAAARRSWPTCRRAARAAWRTTSWTRWCRPRARRTTAR